MFGMRPEFIPKYVEIVKQLFSEYGIKSIHMVDKESSCEYGTVIALLDTVEPSVDYFTTEAHNATMELGLPEAIYIYTDAEEYKSMCRLLERAGGVTKVC